LSGLVAGLGALPGSPLVALPASGQVFAAFFPSSTIETQVSAAKVQLYRDAAQRVKNESPRHRALS